MTRPVPCAANCGAFTTHYGGLCSSWCSDRVRARAEAAAMTVKAKLEAAKADAINHPTHYTATPIEPIDVIEAWKLSFCLGNVVKYIARAGKKDPAKLVEDLKKAQWYLAREIEVLEKGGHESTPDA